MRKTKMIRSVVGIIPLVLLTTFALYFVSALVMAASFATTGASEAETVFKVNITNPGESTISALGYFVRLSNSNDVEMQIQPTAAGDSDMASDTVYAWTNSPSGYKLYLSMLRDADFDAPGSTDKVPGNSLLLGGSDLTHYFKPTAATDLDMNSWGYSLDGAAFSAVPLRGSEDLIKTTSTANELAALNDESVKQPVYYGAKANMEMVSGDYSNTVLYTAVAEASSNPGGELTIAPASTTVKTAATPVKIATSLYTNVEDYGEITAYIGTNGSADDACANVSVDTALTASEGVLVISCDAPARSEIFVTTSYNVYVNVPKFGKTYVAASAFTYTNGGEFWKIANMQEMTGEICAWATTPSVSAATADTTGAYAGNKAYVPQRTLYDIRDGKSYRIRKLADGNCWMTQNLDLALTQGLVLNSSNTDISGTWTVTAAEATVSTTGAKWGTGSAYNDTTQITNAELETVHSYNGNGSAGSRTIATNKGNATPATDGSNAVSPVENQSIGTYYNWYAATAKSGTASITTQGAKAADSICPKGWKLPDSDGSKSFKNLLFTTYGLRDSNAASNGKIRSYPLSFVYSGRYLWVNGTVEAQGVYGSWWSSTALSRTNAYLLHFNYDPRLVPQHNLVRAYGFPIRCVVK